MATFEQRTITQYRIFILWLNPVTDRAEATRHLAYAASEEQLRNWYISQLLPEPEMAGTYRLSFKDGPLRLCNPMYEWIPVDRSTFGEAGFTEMWVEDLSKLPSSLYAVD